MGWVIDGTPRPLYPRERRGSHCIGGWLGPLPSGFDPRIVQSVASRYTGPTNFKRLSIDTG
jgi:hypothetical protein